MSNTNEQVSNFKSPFDRQSAQYLLASSFSISAKIAWWRSFCFADLSRSALVAILRSHWEFLRMMTKRVNLNKRQRSPSQNYPARMTSSNFFVSRVRSCVSMQQDLSAFLQDEVTRNVQTTTRADSAGSTQVSCKTNGNAGNAIPGYTTATASVTCTQRVRTPPGSPKNNLHSTVLWQAACVWRVRDDVTRYRPISMHDACVGDRRDEAAKSEKINQESRHSPYVERP